MFQFVIVLRVKQLWVLLMCGNCVEARKTASKVAAEFDKADSVREYYRKQGECRERERIIKVIEQERFRVLNSSGDADLIKGDAENLEYLIALIKGENK